MSLLLSAVLFTLQLLQNNALSRRYWPPQGYRSLRKMFEASLIPAIFNTPNPGTEIHIGTTPYYYFFFQPIAVLPGKK